MFLKNKRNASVLYAIKYYDVAIGPAVYLDVFKKGNN